MPHGTRLDIEETELRAAIHASPDDDDPRLVYADWLLERDDARGGLIQNQCTRGTMVGARGPLPRNHAAGSRTRSKPGDVVALERLAEREQRLLRAHQKTWIALVRAHVNSWFWHRGFVSCVDANLEKFISFATKIFEFTPLVSFYAIRGTNLEVLSLEKQKLTKQEVTELTSRGLS